ACYPAPGAGGQRGPVTAQGTTDRQAKGSTFVLEGEREGGAVQDPGEGLCKVRPWNSGQTPGPIPGSASLRPATVRPGRRVEGDADLMAGGLLRAGFAEGLGPVGSGHMLRVLATPGFPDYALVDSGDGRKLERFGRFVIERPEPQALWRPALEPGAWLRADATFRAGTADADAEGGRWRTNKPVPEAWPVRVLGIAMLCRLTSFRHIGLFPEQLPHWEWMVGWLNAGEARPARVLNLFAYTGAASLMAAKAGAEVTHVDASRKAIAWAKQNQAVSRLADAPVRWILDDARKFTAREVRRGNRYHVILVDPPKFGRGP